MRAIITRALRNWPYKLVALIAAILLWSHVQGEVNPVTYVPTKVPIRYSNLAKGCVATIIPEEAPISLQGPKLLLDAMDPKRDISASVDLEDLDIGTHTVPLSVTVHTEGRRSGATAVPAVREVAVTIESISSRTMPVEVRLKSSPPIGWATSESTTTPSRSIIMGRSSLVNSVARLVVTADATPLKPAVDDYAQIRALDARGKEIQGLHITPDSARVVFRLIEAPANKAVFVSPSVVGQPQFPYRVTRVTVNPSSVTIKGRPESLVGTSTITTDDVDVTGATGDVVRRATLRVPPGLDVEGSRTVKVTIRIEQGPNTR